MRPHAVFLSDYDLRMTERLVEGVDVWINTPRRPWEACGTSGMKVLVNGGLNVSELDGWWAEAYSPEVGWALGDGNEHGDDPAWDATEAEALYDLLENEVIPLFYKRSSDGLPTAWIGRIRESMARLTPQYSTSRSVREYTEQHYIPAAEAYRERSSDKNFAKQLIYWKTTLEEHWNAIHFQDVKVDAQNKQYEFEVKVYLDGMDPRFVQVELFSNGQNGASPGRKLMARRGPLADNPKIYSYHASCRPRVPHPNTRRALSPIIPMWLCRWKPTKSSGKSESVAPLPVPDFRHVLAMLIDVLLMLDQLVLHLLLQIVPL